MFCDRVVRDLPGITRAALRQAGASLIAPAARRRAIEASEHLVRVISRVAQRFVLSPLTVETVGELALSSERTIQSTRPHLITPAEVTWIEWQDEAAEESGWLAGPRHHALLLDSDTVDGRRSLVQGDAYYLLSPWQGEDLNVVPLRYSLADLAQPLLRHAPLSGALGPDAVAAPRSAAAGLYLPRAGAWLASALALINTPRLADPKFEARQAVNKARLRRRSAPLLTWHQVNIQIDSGEPSRGAVIAATGQRALHHVRSHLRLRLGRVELVRPHWRGSPELGVVRTRRIVTRVEDEPPNNWIDPLPPRHEVITPLISIEARDGAEEMET